VATVTLVLACVTFVCCSSGCNLKLQPAPLPDDVRNVLDTVQAELVAAGYKPCRKLDTIGVAYAWAPCGNRNTADCVEMRGRRQTIVIREGQPLVDSQCGPLCHGSLHVCEGISGHAHGTPMWIKTAGPLSVQARVRDALMAWWRPNL
jgi:hypothetical protein